MTIYDNNKSHEKAVFQPLFRRYIFRKTTVELLSLENKFMESFCVEINLRKTKWLLYYSYSPNRNIDFHLKRLNQNLALYASRMIGDFNAEANNSVK